MAAKQFDKNAVAQDFQWVACMGDFVLLKNLLSKKRHSLPWFLFGLFDALFRGFGQVVFANNPISGIIIMIAFASSAPGIFAAAAGTGFLGLLLSVLLRDVDDNIGNGLTVFNPLLIGSVTYSLVPNVYGDFDAFVVLMIIIATIFSVYLTRSLGTGRFPCLTVPFNTTEIILLLVLMMQRNSSNVFDRTEIVVAEIYNDTAGNNATRSLPIDFDDPTSEALTTEKLNWGLVFRGTVTSASQVYAMDNVAAASVIYLGIIVYSPITGLFSFLGALLGSLVALGLKVPYVSVYAGLWGYNSFLTGAAFGGLYLVMSGQTGVAALVAVIFTTMLQYIAEPLLAKLGLPVLTIPFVVTTWLFIGLRDSIDGVFPRPPCMTFPENEFHNYRSKLRDLNIYTVEDGSDPEIPSGDEKKSTND